MDFFHEVGLKLNSSSARLSFPGLNRKLRPNEWVEDLAEQYEQFAQAFAERFKVGHHDHLPTVQKYLRGLMQADKANMERMSEAVPEADEQVLQHFLTDSPWEYRPVMDQVAHNADAMLGGPHGQGLYLDESGFAKKGDASVGVARQWNGRLGKQDNCQVGVFGALGRGDRVSLIDARLYLPELWTDDPKRCDEAGIPKSEQIHRTKLQLALEIVRHARAIGVQFEWVGVDGLYGNSLQFLQTLNQDAEMFLADVHSDQHIYLTDPAPYLPPQKDWVASARAIRAKLSPSKCASG
jgi:SRSO17 transposase